MNTDEIKIVQAVRDLLTPEENWAKDYYAFDAKGKSTDIPKKACSWCIEGALAHVLKNYDRVDPPYELVKFYLGEPPQIPYEEKLTNHWPTFNDNVSTTHEAVLEALDNRIAQLKNLEKSSNEDSK